MPRFDDGLNVSYKRKRRVKTNPKGCIPNNCKDRFVIYKVGIIVEKSEFGLGFVHQHMYGFRCKWEMPSVNGYMNLKFRKVLCWIK